MLIWPPQALLILCPLALVNVCSFARDPPQSSHILRAPLVVLFSHLNTIIRLSWAPFAVSYARLNSPFNFDNDPLSWHLLTFSPQPFLFIIFLSPSFPSHSRSPHPLFHEHQHCCGHSRCRVLEDHICLGTWRSSSRLPVWAHQKSLLLKNRESTMTQCAPLCSFLLLSFEDWRSNFQIIISLLLHYLVNAHCN